MTTRIPSNTLLTSSLKTGITIAVEARRGGAPAGADNEIRELSPPRLIT